MKKIFLISFISLLLLTGCNDKEKCECNEKEEKIVHDCQCNCMPELPNDNLIGKTFTKTYHIYYIAPSNDYDYIYITIRGFMAEEIETVKVKRSLIEPLEEADYEFTFKINNGLIKDNIKSIFAYSELTNVSKTDKTGLEQVNDFLDEL